MTREEEPRIPSWLFFGLYYGMEKVGKWNDDKEKVARRLMQSLTEHAKSRYWPKEILETALYVNKNDDTNMYGISPKKK